jgi:hypothetical protein
VVRAGGLLIRSGERPRNGWEEKFRALAERGDDALQDGAVATAWEETEWEW